MIKLFEQFGYKEEKRCIALEDTNYELILRKCGTHERSVPRKGKDEFCYKMTCHEKEIHFQTSYFVGIDWIVDNELPIYVQPKQNNDKDKVVEVNYMKMLLEALQASENLNHLDDLVHIQFHKPYIDIEQQQDILSPFLIAQFLQLLKRIVRKGLKKSYYTVTENLNARVKGKILVGRNIKENIVKGRNIHTICQYQEFGVNCEENKILKKAYQFSRRVIQQYKTGFDTRSLLQLINYVHPAFEKVTDDMDISKIKTFKSNPLFKEYDQAIQLALLILKRYSYNISQTEQKKISTPPFWIDMSKLFELYVYKKLRDFFPNEKAVIYHYTHHSKELDFLVNSSMKGIQMVIDAKYKPRYDTKPIELKDYRQVCAYARMKRVYKDLGKSEDCNEIIDCLIIYPLIGKAEEIIWENQKTTSYVRFNKLGIGIPEVQ